MMRIAIGVHGRFSAFNIATGLMELEQEIRLFTNYPPSAVERFGVPSRLVTGFVAHGIATRVAGRVFRARHSERLEAMLHAGFGAWFARQIRKESFDVAYCWSGVAEEAFRETGSLKVLNRSSVHIRVQHHLPNVEAARAGRKIDMPVQWRIDREEREYELADVIIVPSVSARASFDGSPVADRVRVVPLTARSAQWRPPPAVIDDRIHRIERGERLRVLFVGTLSFQKGMYDLARVVQRLTGSMDFRFTGFVLPECRDLVEQLEGRARFDGHVPEEQLRDSYAWADVLVCPSIQDGFAVVLSHAQAAGIPFIASANTGGPDLLAMGGQGWIVPIRAPAAIEEQLISCDANRKELGAMVHDLYTRPIQRSWQDVASEVLACFATARPA